MARPVVRQQRLRPRGPRTCTVMSALGRTTRAGPLPCAPPPRPAWCRTTRRRREGSTCRRRREATRRCGANSRGRIHPVGFTRSDSPGRIPWVPLVPGRVPGADTGLQAFPQRCGSNAHHAVRQRVAKRRAPMRRRRLGRCEVGDLESHPGPPNSALGWLGPVLNLPRSASARAEGPCRLRGCTVRAFRRQFPAAGAGLAGAGAGGEAD